jgi:methionyl-tRNA synthetase
MPTGSDASYTPERFLVRYEELANVLGNLAQRVLSMVKRYRDGVVPAGDAGGLDSAIEETLQAVSTALDGYRLHEALAAAMDLARTANGYVEDREPWAQSKDPDRAADLDVTLASLAKVLTVLAALFHPVCPDRSAELARRLGLSRVPTLAEARDCDPSGRQIDPGTPLFPRVDT